jgi:WD40 repeat protein
MIRFFKSIPVLFVSALLLLAATAPSGSDQALIDQATRLETQGKFVEAYDLLSSLKTRYPNSSLRADAEYRMGLTIVYDNRPNEAALQFQQVISRYPNTEAARLALNMNAILYRLYIAPATDKKIFLPDANYSSLIEALDDPIGLAVDSDGNAYFSDHGKKLLYTLDPKGKMTNSATVLSPYFVSIAPDKQVLIANDTTVYMSGSDNISFSRINPQTQAKAGYLEEIRSVAQNSDGEFYVVSGKMSGVLVYDKNKNPIPNRTLAATEDLGKVVISPRGFIYLMSRKGDLVHVYDADGKSQFTISKTGRDLSVGRFDDIAVDNAGNLYLLTGNPRGIMIYSPQNKYLRYLGSEKNSALSFENARAIAIGPTGSIYVLDKGTKRVIKLG